MNFSGMFNPSGLKVPAKAPPKKARLCASKGFSPPGELLLDGYCTPAEDQGATPMCAAYAASNFAESVLWRRNGRQTQVDPSPVYDLAKTIDGSPGTDGTYLESALEALVRLGIMPDMCKVRTFGSSSFGLGPSDGLDELKYAIHRYGCCVAGFMITDEWFEPKRGTLRGSGLYTTEGGHAVLACGYDKDGVIVMNSWGKGYGHDGKVYLANRVFREQFMYGAVLTHALDGLE